MSKPRTLALTLAASALLAPAAARADGFLLVSGGVVFPIGDQDWEDTVDSSPTLVLRGGGGRAVDARSRVFAEATFEYSPLSDNVSNDLFSIDLERYRALLGVRFERSLTPTAVLALRGGLGISHLRAEVSSPLLPNVSSSDTDTGLALEVGAGVWFAAGPVHIGFELDLPIGLHSDEAQDANDISYDFRTTEVSLLGGVRFSI